MPWHSVHVHYHDEDKDGLILDALRPLFDGIGGHVPRAYFTRHWKRGPHLRLHFDTTPQLFRELVRPRLEEVVGGYLVRHPSTARLDPRALLPQHERLAEVEREPGPLLPWLPDNSIQDADYDYRLDTLGTRQAADLLAEFHLATTQLAFAMTDRIRAGHASRPGLAFDLMLTTAHVFYHDSGITSGFGSFRSHAEAFLCAWPEGHGLRPAWEQQYTRNADTLTDRVRAVVATLDGDTDRVRFVRDWVARVTPIRRRAEELISTGRFPAVKYGNPGGPDLVPRPLNEVSPYHRALEANERWRTEIRDSTRFALYRVMLNYTYLYMTTRLGCTPVQRFRLCHLAANAVEDVYGISAMRMVTR
jgi:hypothetical protein